MRAVCIFENLRKHNEALEIMKEVIEIENMVLPPDYRCAYMSNRYYKKILYWKITEEKIEVDPIILERLKKYKDV